MEGFKALLVVHREFRDAELQDAHQEVAAAQQEVAAAQQEIHKLNHKVQCLSQSVEHEKGKNERAKHAYNVWKYSADHLAEKCEKLRSEIQQAEQLKTDLQQELRLLKRRVQYASKRAIAIDKPPAKRARKDVGDSAQSSGGQPPKP